YANTRYVQKGCTSVMARLTNAVISVTGGTAPTILLPADRLAFDLLANSTTRFFAPNYENTLLADDPFLFVSDVVPGDGGRQYINNMMAISPILGLEYTTLDFVYVVCVSQNCLPNVEEDWQLKRLCFFFFFCLLALWIG